MTNSLLASLNAVAIRTVQIQSNEEVVTKTVKQFNPEIPYFGRYAVTPSNTAELCHNVKDSRDLFMSLSPSATWLILINPTVFIPDNSTFEAVLHHWIALGGKL